MSFVSCVRSSFFFSYQSESNRIYSPTLFVSNSSSTMPKNGKIFDVADLQLNGGTTIPNNSSFTKE